MKYLKALHVVIVYAFCALSLVVAYPFAARTVAYYDIEVQIGVAQAGALQTLARAVHGT